MDPLLFGDRQFELITASTVERDITLSNLLDGAGVKEAIIQHLSDEDAMNAALTQALAGSGKLFEILGCSVMDGGFKAANPCDVHGATCNPGLHWTPAIGRQTASYLARLPAEGNTRRILIAAVALVRAFFTVELLSMATSLRSSLPPEVAQFNPSKSVET
jgi:hypothetical protein